MREPRAVWLRALIDCAKQQARVFEKISGQRARLAITDYARSFLFEIIVERRVLGDLGLRAFDSIVCSSGRFKFGIASGICRIAQFLLAGFELRPNLRVQQSGQMIVLPWDWKFEDNAGFYKVFVKLKKGNGPPPVVIERKGTATKPKKP